MYPRIGPRFLNNIVGKGGKICFGSLPTVDNYVTDTLTTRSRRGAFLALLITIFMGLETLLWGRKWLCVVQMGCGNASSLVMGGRIFVRHPLYAPDIERGPRSTIDFYESTV